MADSEEEKIDDAKKALASLGIHIAGKIAQIQTEDGAVAVVAMGGKVNGEEVGPLPAVKTRTPDTQPKKRTARRS